MIINTKYKIGEPVMFHYGPNEIEMWGDVCGISVTVSNAGKINVKYWVIFAGCHGLWIKEKELSK